MATASVNSARGYKIIDDGELVTAEDAISAYYVVIPGTDKNARGGTQVLKATGVTANLLGAVQAATDLAIADTARLFKAPNRPLVKLGGTVNRGDYLTSADGTATAAADGNYVFGRACDYGVVGDIIAYEPVSFYLETT